MRVVRDLYLIRYFVPEPLSRKTRDVFHSVLWNILCTVIKLWGNILLDLFLVTAVREIGRALFSFSRDFHLVTTQDIFQTATSLI